MASAVAQPLYRAPALDHQPLRTGSADLLSNRYHALNVENRGSSTLPPPSLFDRDLSRPATTSPNDILFQTSQFHNRSVSLSIGRHEEYKRPQVTRPALPGLSELASLTTTPTRSFSGSSLSHSSTPMQPIPTPGISGNNNAPPVCQNCQTSTTPLWRRDEAGSVLCNACGLFLKLHGRPRPISLKTDVIKSRNRVKSSTHGQRKKFEHGLPASQSEVVTPLNGSSAHRRVSQMAASIASDRSHSPVSRTHTPTGHHDPNIAPQHLFDGVTLNDHHFQSPSLPGLQLGQPSPGSAISDRHMEAPMTYEQLLAANTILKTRVSELEVIQMMYSDNENTLRNERDAAVRAQDDLKQRVQELENELRLTRDVEHVSKKPRLSES